jgi:hypothetical protein
MSVQINWKILSMDYVPLPQYPDLPIYVVHWNCQGSIEVSKSGSRVEVTYDSFGDTVVELYKMNFKPIPFDQLKEQDVVAWVKEVMGYDNAAALERLIKDKTEERAASKSGFSPRLPWLPPPEPPAPPPAPPTPEEISADTLSRAIEEIQDKVYLTLPNVQDLLIEESAASAVEYINKLGVIVGKAQNAVQKKVAYAPPFPTLILHFKAEE